MYGIKEFFKKIQSKYTQELFIRTVIQETLQSYIHQKTPLDDIRIENTSITLQNSSPTVKSQLLIKKTKILAEINSKQTIRVFTELR